MFTVRFLNLRLASLGISNLSWEKKIPLYFQIWRYFFTLNYSKVEQSSSVVCFVFWKDLREILQTYSCERRSVKCKVKLPVVCLNLKWWSYSDVRLSGRGCSSITEGWQNWNCDFTHYFTDIAVRTHILFAWNRIISMGLVGVGDGEVLPQLLSVIFRKVLKGSLSVYPAMRFSLPYCCTQTWWVISLQFLFWLLPWLQLIFT